MLTENLSQTATENKLPIEYSNELSKPVVIKPRFDKYELNFLKLKFEDVTNSDYEFLKRVLVDYMSNPNYVFKICEGSTKEIPNYEHITCDFYNKFFVVLEKPEDVFTNEERVVSDSNYASYRANKLLVKKIIDMELLRNISYYDYPKGTREKNIEYFKNNSIESIISRTYLGFYSNPVYTKYQVGQYVQVDNYCSDITKICTTGIHYYKTPHAAYFLKYRANYSFETIKASGYDLKCDDTGKNKHICYFNYGKKWHEKYNSADLEYCKTEGIEFTTWYGGPFFWKSTNVKDQSIATI